MDKKGGEIGQELEGSSSRHTEDVFGCEKIPSRILSEKLEVK